MLEIQMNKALVLGIAAAASLGFALPAAANDEKLDASALFAVSDVPDMIHELPLPPRRPAILAQRRIRVSQALPAEPAQTLRPVAPATRKLAPIWLSIGYGF
jgi:hypothetical protein